MLALARSRARALSLPLVIFGAAALSCGSPPPAAPSAPAPIAAAPKEPPIDTSPVPEPPGLVVVGRVNKPDAMVSAAASWTRLPLPSGADLVRSVTDDSVAAVVDLSQPVDMAVRVGLSSHGLVPLAAFSVAVKSYDQAKAKLSESHRLVPGENGQFKVVGVGSKKRSSHRRPSEAPAEDAEDDGDDDADGCVLAPSSSGGRLVCGEGAALESLVPYLSRTMPREKWSSDVHVEVRLEPVRAPLEGLRSSGIARSVLGSQASSLRALADAAFGEVIDVVNDAQKITFDARIAESGVVGETRFEFQSTRSLVARVLTTDRADSPPAAFWHLPGDTDAAFFGRGSDPKLFEHPRELVGNLLLEGASSEGMPEAERNVVRELVADRMLALFTNDAGIYAKGFDEVAVEKALTNLKALKPENRAGRDDAKRALVEQSLGWHLYRVNEPVAKVGPILKDWSSLWNRPAFAKWAQTKMSAKELPRLRVAPMPAGVTLPKETVHLEVTIPREDIEESASAEPISTAVARPSAGKGAPVAAAMAKPGKVKKIPRKPVVVHLFAVPDAGTTWLGLGLDAKLVAQKAAASLATAPDANTLGKVAGTEALREGKINGGGFFTLRGVMAIAALDDLGERSPGALLGALPHKGNAPIVLVGRAEGPSPRAKAGSAVGTVHVSRAVIEDIVRLAMSGH